MTTTNSPCSQFLDAAPETEKGPEQDLASDKVFLTFVVAVADNGVIGRNGGLPWRLSSDLKLFRRLTMGKPIIMGRRTWQSLPKRPLDGRENIVVTRDQGFVAEGARIVADAGEAVDLATGLARKSGVDEISVIGGAALYEALLEKADRIYWTAVRGNPEGDTTFPDFDLSDWKVVCEEPIERGPKDEFEAVLRVMERI